MIAFSVVLLPAPLRPISPTTSPGPTSSATSNRICARPYQAFRLCAERSAVMSMLSRRHRHRRRGGEQLAAAEIHLAHFFVIADRLRRAAGNKLAAREHDD